MSETRCVNCGDIIECVEGVLWIHDWEEHYPGISKERTIRKEFCLVDSWCAKHGYASLIDAPTEIMELTSMAMP